MYAKFMLQKLSFLEFAKNFLHKKNIILVIIEHLAVTWLQIIGIVQE